MLLVVLEGVVGRGRWALRVRLAAVGAMARGLGEEGVVGMAYLWLVFVYNVRGVALWGRVCLCGLPSAAGTRCMRGRT